MSRLWTRLEKFVASFVLGVLVIAAVAAPTCPTCSRIDIPSANHAALSRTDHNGPPSCDKEGCSCCGFQMVNAPLGLITALTRSASTPEYFAVLAPFGPDFVHY